MSEVSLYTERSTRLPQIPLWSPSAKLMVKTQPRPKRLQAIHQPLHKLARQPRPLSPVRTSPPRVKGLQRTRPLRVKGLQRTSPPRVKGLQAPPGRAWLRPGGALLPWPLRSPSVKLMVKTGALPLRRPLPRRLPRPPRQAVPLEGWTPMRPPEGLQRTSPPRVKGLQAPPGRARPRRPGVGLLP